MGEKKVAAKSRNIQATILQWQWNPVETFLRNLEEDRKSKNMLLQVLDVRNDDNRPSLTSFDVRDDDNRPSLTSLDVRNDDNRPSLTSSAAADYRQEVSSKNTVDELTDAIFEDIDIGLWLPNIP